MAKPIVDYKNVNTSDSEKLTWLEGLASALIIPVLLIVLGCFLA